MIKKINTGLGVGTWNFFPTRAKLLLALVAWTVGAHSSDALSIYSPRGAELFGSLQSLIPPPSKQIRIQWDFPLQRVTPDLVFKIYHSTNLVQPVGRWALLTNIAGDIRFVDFPADKPQEFFAITVSNYLGETDLVSLPSRKIKILWDYPVQLVTPDLVFKIYHSTNLAQPPKQWALLTNLPGHLRNVELPPDKAQEFFAITASNYLGESSMASR